MTNTNDVLLSPWKLAGLPLRNRLAVAPMTRVSATRDGMPTDVMVRYYERFARGGFGLVLTEGLYTDQAWSQGYPCQPGLSSDSQAQAWADLVQRLQGHGTGVIAQIMHSGALVQGNRFRADTLAPSAIQPAGEQLSIYHGQGRYATPMAMTDEQIADVIAGFAQAAGRAIIRSGFDGVELHGANGYLLDQFLSSQSNQRTDRWGGSVRQRMALILEIVKSARAAMGGRGLLGVRISQSKVNDFHARWSGGEADAETIFGSLADSGVDYIHTTDYKAWTPAFTSSPLSLARAARRYAPRTFLIANGDLHHFEHARALLETTADVAAIGKAALANPDLPLKLAAGKTIAEFSQDMLTPIASIRDSELVES
ncbi:NADH:flavin oxidoreductase [Pectobacterium aroidearum]|uniref:NADH:flavin oxidoreductase n=1 Tax=Pectobacterium aroidearum TaxID=1201031 RepID=UPI0032F051F1